MPAPSLGAAPPAVWTAFATQARWKNWVMGGQLLLIALLVLVCFALAKRESDVIVVDDTGRSHYVERTASSDALVRFLDGERKRASDLTLSAYAERFVRLTSGVNSATIEESFAEALTFLAAPLAEKIAAEAKQQKLVETYRLAQIRTQLTVDDVQLVERRGDKAHVRVLLTKQKTKLFDSATVGPSETQVVDLILVDVPRTRRRPDGLEILEWHTAPRSPEVREGEADGPVPTTTRPGGSP